MNAPPALALSDFLRLRSLVSTNYGTDSVQVRELDRIRAALFVETTTATTPLRREVKWR